MNKKQDKQKLIIDLQKYVPYNQLELKHKGKILYFLWADDNNFERSNLHGHITASAWLLNKNRDKVLLNHHRKLQKWMNFGGHADGNADILAVAIKETQEETGFEKIYPVCKNIFDVDVHVIPANATKEEPEHLHYDIRYLLWTPEQEFCVSEESVSLKWASKREVLRILEGESLMRMIKKWLRSG